MKKVEIIEELKEKPKNTTVDTILYDSMKKKGICQINKDTYSKTIEFEDINYFIESEQEQERIFKMYFSFLNSFNDDIDVQLSFFNTRKKINPFFDFKKELQKQDDEYSELRKEYFSILQEKSENSTLGIEKHKYITFTIKEQEKDLAYQKLAKIEENILINFQNMKIKAKVLDGFERLKLLQAMMNNEREFELDKDWKLVTESGVPTKAIISPSYMNFKAQEYCEFDNSFYQTMYLSIDASELSDLILKDILDLDDEIIVTIHFNSKSPKDSLKFVQDKDTDIKSLKIEYQQKAFLEGFSGDIMPSNIEIYSKEADGLLYDMKYGNSKMFLSTILITIKAKSAKELKNKKMIIDEILNKHLCRTIKLSYRQEQALNSFLPIGKNYIHMDRMLTTNSLAIFIPFLTNELNGKTNRSLYYGLNALSKNMIMVDRLKLRNPNGLILGTPGSGKSFSAKREIVNALLMTNDDILICDPEDEYSDLVKSFHGQLIKISINSKEYINPLDIDITNDKEDPIKSKADFVLSLFELVSNTQSSENILSAAELSVIDRCLPKIYEKYLQNPIPKNMPILEDLYNLLMQQGEVGKKLAIDLEIYVKGSLNIFNHHTNIDIKNRLVCFNIKEIGHKLQKIGMLILFETVWNRVSKNRNNKKITRYYIDEFHLLLKTPQTAYASLEIWKRFRKWGGVPTGITQNISDLLASREIENIFSNTDFVYLLNQSSSDGEVLAKKLGISKNQLKYITNSKKGQGLIKFDEIILPFEDKFPKNTKLYKLMTTNFTENLK